MPVLIYSMPYVLSQNQKMQGCQWYGVQRIKAFFANKKSCEKVRGTSLLPQVVLISSRKPSSSSISLKKNGGNLLHSQRAGVGKLLN